MYVPHSQAEFKRLFTARQAYVPQSGFGATPAAGTPLAADATRDSICTKFTVRQGGAEPEARSKFWLGMYRRGLDTTTTPSTREANVNQQQEFRTEDPYFFATHRTATSCTRTTTSTTPNIYASFIATANDIARPTCPVN